MEDPGSIPSEVSASVEESSRELGALASDGSVTLADAQARVDAIVARFESLAASLDSVLRQSSYQRDRRMP